MIWHSSHDVKWRWMGVFGLGGTSIWRIGSIIRKLASVYINARNQLLLLSFFYSIPACWQCDLMAPETYDTRNSKLNLMTLSVVSYKARSTRQAPAKTSVVMAFCKSHSPMDQPYISQVS